MDLLEHLPDRSAVREFWPLFFGLALILVGNVYYYGVLENEWQPFSPPLFVAVLVVALIEVGRSLYAQL